MEDVFKTFYTYKITAANSDKYYYGVSHVKKANATVEDCLNDGYFGSGNPKNPQNKFNNWKKVHFKKIQKEILKIHKNELGAYTHEEKLVKDSWSKDKKCLNSCPGGKTSYPLQGLILLKNCPIHGESKHRGSKCFKCTSSTIKTLGNCSVHGETIFWGKQCSKCSSLGKISMKICPVHGETKHKGDVCYQCESKVVNSLKECPIHGLVAHQGDTCSKCVGEKRTVMKFCEIHGETKFQGNSCYQCLTLAKNVEKFCPIHGLTKHYGNTCAKCSLTNVYSIGECIDHGEVKLRNGKCTKCSAQKTAHSRFHKAAPKENCIYCFPIS